MNPLAKDAHASARSVPVTDIETAIDCLNDAPSPEQVTFCLSVVEKSSSKLIVPSPLSIRFFSIILKKTLPDFQNVLLEDDGHEEATKDLLALFRSVSGISLVISQLKLLRDESHPSVENSVRSTLYLKLLELALLPETTSFQIWENITKSDATDVEKRLVWSEYLKITASGSLTSTASQTEDFFKGVTRSHHSSWLSSGSAFAGWLGRNIFSILEREDQSSGATTEISSSMLSKALLYGYQGLPYLPRTPQLHLVMTDFCLDTLLKTILLRAFLSFERSLPVLSNLFQSLRSRDQAKAVELTLRALDVVLEPGTDDTQTLIKSSDQIAGMTEILRRLFVPYKALSERLSTYVVPHTRFNAYLNFTTRRAIIASLAKDENKLQSFLEICWTKFMDNLFIQHAAFLEQQTLAQNLLVTAGYVHRSQPMAVFVIAKSSQHNRGISQRLAIQNERVRLLGMLVAMAVSELVDKGDIRLKFEGPEMQTPEAKWYLTLTRVADEAGDPTQFIKTAQENLESALLTGTNLTSYQRPEIPSEKRAGRVPKSSAPAIQGNQKLDFTQSLPSSLRITEVSTGPEEEEMTLSLRPGGFGSSIQRVVDLDAEAATLTPYPKPDSDPEDDSTDPTLVTRNKPKPPVYVRALLKDLSDAENFERRTLALRTAPQLIRRKANFGSEVSENAGHLATALANLSNSDDFNVDSEEEFLQLRERSLRAVLIACPEKIGKWLGAAVVHGEYSIQQKLGMLVAIGLGAREIAGLDEDKEDYDKENPAFPSKQLKGEMAQVWGDASLSKQKHSLRAHAPQKYTRIAGTQVDDIAVRLSRTLLEPMALSAADALTGPNILKVKRFSSRLDTEKKRKKPASNGLSSIVADSFFYPLLGALESGFSTTRASAPSSAHLLPTYLRTLTLLLDAAGPSCPALPQLTSDYWPIVLLFRSSAFQNPLVLEAILFSILTILELHSERQDVLVRDHAKIMLESQEWARTILENPESVGGEELERIQLLAAGVVVKCGEIVENHRRAFLGSMID